MPPSPPHSPSPPTDTSLRRHPVLFGPDAQPLTGLYHPPIEPLRPVGVVICNPLGYEAQSVHRATRHLAEALAAAGIAVLRFDHDGTGDSPADSDRPHRVASWLAGIRSAIAELRARASVHSVVLLGIGTGGLLAGCAAAGQEVDGLVLWAPLLSGRLHVRELKAFRLFKYSKSGPAPRDDGGEEIAGYLFTKETLADLSALDLLSFKERPARRALVLSRGDRPAEVKPLVDQLSALGTEAVLAPDPGYGAMMRDDPYDSVVPETTLRAIVDWIAAGAPPTPRSEKAPPPIPARIAVGDRGVRESPLLFGTETGSHERLFGVLTEPTPNTRADTPAVILLNVGSNTHVGPHRMNVELARELAARGYVSLRYDASGLGESGPHPGSEENQLYTLEHVADAKAAMSLIEERCGLRRFVLVGLCSGAYVAFHAAVQDDRVVGQILLSPFAFEWHQGDPVKPVERSDARAYRSTRFYAEAALDPQAWKKVLKGEVDVAGIAAAMIERAQDRFEAAVPEISSRLRGHQRPRSEIESQFRALCDRGVETFVAISFEDGGLDMLGKYLGNDARRMRGRKQFVLQILRNADHTFTTLASQKALRELIAQYMGTRFG